MNEQPRARPAPAGGRKAKGLAGSPRAKRLAGGLGLAALGLLLGLLLLEGAVRILAPETKAHALPQELTVLDPDLGWRLGRGLELRHRSPYFDVLYRTNELGFRDPPRAPEPGAAARVLLFGDSQVFGWGLPAEQRFSNRLEACIPGLELWNLGVPGYGLDQQLLAWEGSPRWGAEAVILYISEATLHRLRFAYLFGAYKPRFEVAGGGLRHRPPSTAPGRRLLYRLPAWMHLPYFLDQRLSLLDERLRGGPGDAGGAGELGRLLLERARAEVGGTRLLVLSHLPERRRRELGSLCRALELPHLPVDLGPEPSRFTLGAEDPHWNAEAHRRIAEQLAPALERIVSEQQVRAGAAPPPG